jgi:hypothetical protein
VTDISRPSEHNEEVQEPNLEQVYTNGILGNTLTWGDQPIPKPMDEVADIHAIDYDQMKKAIFQRTTKKRRIILDRSILITTEEHLINTVLALCKYVRLNRKTTEVTVSTYFRAEALAYSTQRGLSHFT